MKIRNIDGETPYWDECNKNNILWFKKGKIKRLIRKKIIKKRLNDLDYE